MSETDTVQQSQTQNQTQTQNQKKEEKVNFLYTNILQNIKNMNVLSSYQIYYLREMSKSNLIEIIELYNLVMRNVNEII
jgi:hypothetical protein